MIKAQSAFFFFFLARLEKHITYAKTVFLSVFSNALFRVGFIYAPTPLVS